MALAASQTVPLSHHYTHIATAKLMKILNILQFPIQELCFIWHTSPPTPSSASHRSSPAVPPPAHHQLAVCPHTPQATPTVHSPHTHSLQRTSRTCVPCVVSGALAVALRTALLARQTPRVHGGVPFHGSCHRKRASHCKRRRIRRQSKGDKTTPGCRVGERRRAEAYIGDGAAGANVGGQAMKCRHALRTFGYADMLDSIQSRPCAR